MSREVLYIFDFDDTLALTNSHVRVIKSDGRIDRLDSREFAAYRPAPGDSLDFSEFTEASGTLIDDTVEAMEHAIDAHGIENVFIVTARSDPDPVSDFLISMDVSSPEVVATAGSPGKATWLTRKLVQNDYEAVYVYEDCRKNISMLKDIVEIFNEDSGRPPVDYRAICILPSGKQEIVENILRDYIKSLLLVY